MIDTTGLYLENYGIYKDLIINEGIDIDVRDFTKENFDSHFYSILKYKKCKVGIILIFSYWLLQLNFSEQKCLILLYFQDFLNMI